MDTADHAFLRPIRLPVTLPASYFIVLVSLHVPAAGLPWFTTLPWHLKFLLSLAVVASGYYHVSASALVRTARLISELVLDASDEWQLKLENGEFLSASFGDRYYIHPYWLLLELKHDQQSCFFILTPEFIDTDSLRRLRVRLKHRLQSSTG